MQRTRNRDSKSIATADPTRSSVLIPASLMSFFEKRCRDFGCRKDYLHFLVAQYLPLSAHFEHELRKHKYPKCNTVYQKENLDLKKKSFVPAPEDWEMLRNAAGAFGVSMCYLFVFLMELEIHPPQIPPPGQGQTDWGRNSVPKINESGPFRPRVSVLVRRVDQKRRKLIRQNRIT